MPANEFKINSLTMLSIITAAVGIVVFYPVINLPFIAGDGNFFRQTNPFLSQTLPHLSLLPGLIVALSKKIPGANPVFLRTLMTALHITNALLVFKLTQTIFKEKRFFAFMAAVIFGLHPLNTMGVYFVLNLGKIMAVTFVLFAIIDFEKNKNFLSSFIIFIPAVLCDIFAVVTAVCVLTLIDKKNSKGWIVTAGFLTALLLFKFMSVDFGNFNIAAYFKEVAVSILQIINYTLIPLTGIIYPDKPQIIKFAFSVFTLTVFFTAMVFSLKNKKTREMLPALWAILWILPFVLQIKTMGNFTQSDKLIEFNTYGISLPLIFIVLSFLKDISRHRTVIIRYLYGVLFVFVSLAFIDIAKKQMAIARNESVYYQSIAAGYPNRYFINQYAEYLINERKNFKAYGVLSKILKKEGSAEEISNSYFLISKACLNEYLTDYAIGYLKIAVKTNPQNYKAKAEIIKAYGQAGLYKDGLKLADKYTLNYSDKAEIHYQTGLLYLKLQDYPNAFKNFNVSCRLNKKYCTLQYKTTNPTIKTPQ